MTALATQIEALLFASDQPLPLARLCEVLDGVPRAEIEAALDALAESHDTGEGALCLTQVAGGWQLATKPDLAPIVRRLFTGRRRVRLTKAALESLAIIAYKQPTTRPEIDAIRGVASGGVLETLLERNLVRIAGRSEGIGRPLLYATTPEFLQYLGLNRLADLPSLEELEAMLAEREAAARLADEAEMQELADAAREGPPPGTPVEPSARLEEKLRANDLPTLEELDAELRDRSDQLHELSSRVATARREHAQETGAAAAAPADASADAGEDAAPADALPAPATFAETPAEPSRDAPGPCD
jgi:segregation and condensation protein B